MAIFIVERAGPLSSGRTSAPAVATRWPRSNNGFFGFVAYDSPVLNLAFAPLRPGLSRTLRANALPWRVFLEEEQFRRRKVVFAQAGNRVELWRNKVLFF